MDCCVEQKPVILPNGQAIALSTTSSNTTTTTTIVTNSSSSGSGKDSFAENICKECQLPITDEFMLKVCAWTHHENCVRCCVCIVPLFSRCYERNGQLYCRLHYYREYSPYRCAGCRQGIAPTEMVYKIKTKLLFHVSCHRCVCCGRKLFQGEQICIDETSNCIACIAHIDCNKDLFGISMPTTSTVCLVGTDEDGPLSNTIPRELDSPSNFFPYSYDVYGCEYSDESKFLKRRGPRTTIKQYQLDVLNRMFTSTPKPSKHARAKLALETGLSMRVIQVWFQNRRSKERRLKHLCNYLRRFEQRGLIPPSISLEHTETGRTSSTDTITLEQLLSFPFEADDEGGEMIS